MTSRRRALLAGIALGLLILGLLILGGLGLRFDPFDLSRQRLERAESRAADAEMAADARRMEVAGERDTAVRVEQAQAQVDAATRLSLSLTSDAGIARDAKAPLDPDRIERLRRHDHQLCQLRPAICAHAAATNLASNGPADMPAGGSVARQPDAG